jgi:hypothetical protein
MPRGDRRGGQQWVLQIQRFDVDVLRHGEVALCARINERGEPQIVVEVSFIYFPTWWRASVAKLLERWPSLPFTKPRTVKATHSMAYPGQKFRPRR